MTGRLLEGEGEEEGEGEGKEQRPRPLRGEQAVVCRLLCAQCFGLQQLGFRPAMTGRMAFCKELFMQGEIDHLGSY
jgi:hypothetical protein